MTTESPTHHQPKKKRPQIPMRPVESNQVHAIGYDASTRTLAMQFVRREGGKRVDPQHEYHYPEVEPHEHQALVNADSIGKHFGQHIKHRPFEKYPLGEEHNS